MKPEENGNMLFFKRLLTIVLSAALIGPTMPLEARGRKGDKALTEGRATITNPFWVERTLAVRDTLARRP